MTSATLNATLDRLPRTRVARAAREAPAFRASGVTGFYAALVALLAGGLLDGLSLLVLAAVAIISAASFFLWALARRALTGREELVLLEHVWFAEACVAVFVAALGEPVLPYLDVLAVALCVFLAGGRVGCLLAGCCHGRPSSFGIRYGDEAVADGFPRHLVGVRLLPVPAFEAAGLLAIGAAGIAALPDAAAGTVFAWFLASYAVLRFGLEALRGDRRPHVLGLSINRWMCVTELAVALTIASWPLDAQDAALGALLAATLAVALLVRRAHDDRRRLLAPAHVAELRALTLELASRAAVEPRVGLTSAGVRIAVSRDDRTRLSISVPGLPRDVPLLCELAARALPDLDAAEAVLGDAALHVASGGNGGGADALYGSILRRDAAEPPRLAAGHLRRDAA